MASERFVLLGIAQVRAPWFRDVARWATSAMLPIEFVKAMSMEEVRVRLRSGRAYSAVLVDGGLSGADRDLLELAAEAGSAVVVIDAGRAEGKWSALGAAAELPSAFGRDDLLQVLTQVATPIAHADQAVARAEPGGPASGFRGHLVATTGAGGVGTSTIAAAVAQGLGGDPRHRGLVCLADLALDADQAMLHGSPDVVPGVVELAEAHRSGSPSIEDIRALTWQVRDRGYHLLLGLRRHRDWTAVRPRAFAAGLDGLRRSFRLVVADVGADLEGEAATGSVDVEERNAMARTVLGAADLVVVVGLPGLKGIHSLVRTTRDLLAHGVAPDGLLPTLNRSSRNPRTRAQVTAAFAQLLSPTAGCDQVPTLLHLPDRRHLDQILRDAAPLPGALSSAISGPVQARLEQITGSSAAPTDHEPVPVAPGSLGSWHEEGEG